MILTDASALVALLHVRDAHHQESVAIMSRLSSESMVTTWACFTEAMHILGDYGGYTYQSALWGLRTSGRLALHNHEPEDIDRMAALMTQYRDTPMDLADASLIATAESLDLRQVFTFDSDFYIYRLADGNGLDIIR